jgi:acetyl esterase/lipase
MRQSLTIATLLIGAGAVLGQAQQQSPPVPGAGRGGGAAINAEPQLIPLWEQAPGALGDTPSDRPSLTLYRPSGPSSNGTGTAVIIAPGGAYQGLAIVHEGVQEAYWFNALGVTALVLQYRLGPRYRHPVELGDAQRAIRLVRARATEWNIATDRIGMMGFSAGGHLAATAGTHFDAGKTDAPDPIDRVSSRPDFLILGYPVISMQPSLTHPGSYRNLLGENPDPKLVDDLSNELRVTAETPPAFLFHTTNDQVVQVENSIAFYRALNRAKVPAEMHIFENGPHGFGMGLTDPVLGVWPGLLANWMRARGLLTARSSPR